MIKFNETVSYVETRTITGKKIIVGDKKANSFALVKKKEHTKFKELFELLKRNEYEKFEDIPLQYQSLAYALQQKGYFDDDHPTTANFNEYKKLSKEIYKKDFDYVEKKENENILKNILYYIALLVVAILVLYNLNMEKLTINFENVNLFEIISSIIFLPIIIIATHELGHYLLAKYAGVSVSSLVFCFVVIYPSVYLSYRGINLCKTRNKIMIISGSIFAHLLGALLGIYLINIGYDLAFLKLWVLSNISMAITNLIPLAASDGYYMLSAIMGIFNFRLKGYKAIHHWLHRNNKAVARTDLICGIYLLVLWSLSFYGLHSYFVTLANVFSINVIIINILYALSCVLLILRFINKMYKMKFA